MRTTSRRARATTVAAVAGLVVAAAGLVACGAPPGDGTEFAAEPLSDVAVAELAVPDGMQLVGYGRVAVVVPSDWSIGDEYCGTPQSDTVLLPMGLTLGCAPPVPPGVTNVQLWSGEQPVDDLLGVEGSLEGRSMDGQFGTATLGEPVEIDVDGAPGVRVDECPTLQGFCGTRLTVAGQTLQVVSTRTPLAVAREAVEEVVAGVRVLDETVAVSPAGLVVEGPVAAAHAQQLEALGLVVERRVVTAPPPYAAGDLVRTVPDEGAIVPLGSTVVLEVAGDPDADAPGSDGGPSVTVATDHADATDIDPFIGTLEQRAGFTDAELSERARTMGEGIELLGVAHEESADGQRIIYPEGVAGVAMSTPTLTITVWVVGGTLPPDRLDAVADEYPEIEVDVVAATYDGNHLQDLIRDHRVTARPGVTAVSARSDGTAIVVMHDDSPSFDPDAIARDVGVPVITLRSDGPQLEGG